MLSVSEAHKAGIFNRLVSDLLLEEAGNLALRLAQGPFHAMGLTKKFFNRAVSGSLENQLEMEKEAVIRCSGTAEFKEGISAFFEKRKPKF